MVSPLVSLKGADSKFFGSAVKSLFCPLRIFPKTQQLEKEIKSVSSLVERLQDFKLILGPFTWTHLLSFLLWNLQWFLGYIFLTLLAIYTEKVFRNINSQSEVLTNALHLHCKNTWSSSWNKSYCQIPWNSNCTFKFLTCVHLRFAVDQKCRVC